VIGARPILLTIVLFDRYLAHRRGLAANADYVARIQSSRDNAELQRAGRLRRANQQSDGLLLGDLRGNSYLAALSTESTSEKVTGAFKNRRRLWLIHTAASAG
jgi:hypothetical protein